MFEWFKNRSQTVTSYANFEKQKPTGGWFKITDAHLNIPGAMWITSSRFSDDKDKIYVPLAPEGEDKPGTKIHVLVEVDDAATKKLVDELSDLDKSNVSEEKALEYVLKNNAKLFPTRPVAGMVKFGLNDMKSKERNKIAALNSDLASDFVVLEENAKPNGGGSILMFIAGIAITLFSLAGFLGGKGDKNTPATATPIDSASAPPPPPPSGPPANPMSGGSAG